MRTSTVALEALRSRLPILLIALAGAGLAPAHAADGTAPIGLFEIVLDGRHTATIGRFVWRDGQWQASAAQWQAWGVRAAARAEAPEALLPASALPGVRARLDVATQTLAIDQAADLSRLTTLGPAAADRGAAAPSPDAGAVLNYDALVWRGAGRSTHSALLEGRAFGGGLLWEHTVVASDAHAARSGGAAPPRVLRLHSGVTHADPARLRRVRLGDLVSGALGWSRPLRLLGVQMATDFALRPDLVTTPTPQLGGVATVPSTVDVLIDGVRQLSQPVEPGRFEVRQLPMLSGAGEVSLVLRDALGRETVQRLAFYTAPRQLAAGLSEFSAEAGALRRRYGVASNEYRGGAASVSLRHGLDDRVTLEGHAEAGPDLLQAGAALSWALPALGAIQGHAATSRHRGAGGHAWGLAVERQGRSAGASLQWSGAQASYRDLAATQGDAVPRRSVQASASFGLAPWGQVAAAWVRRDLQALPARPALPPVRLATASWSVSLARGAQLQLHAFRDRSASGSRGASLTLALPLGDRRSFVASLSNEPAGSALTLHAAQAAFEPGQVGWRTQLRHGSGAAQPDRALAELEVLGETLRSSAGVERVAGASALRVGAQGALVWIGGQTHATRRSADGLALVEVGDARHGTAAPGVSVFHQNRYMGRTGTDGRLLVPGLLPFQANRLHYEALDLPIDLQPRDVEAVVDPGDRGGVVLRFAIDRSRGATWQLRDAAGRPLPLGAVAAWADGSARSVVGHDGMVALAPSAGARRIDVFWAGERLCSASAEALPVGARQAVALSCSTELTR